MGGRAWGGVPVTTRGLALAASRSVALGLGACLALGLALGGCASPAPEPGTAAPTGPVPTSDADAQRIAAETYRSRFDVAAEGIQVSVTNRGDEAVTVVATRVHSPGLLAPAASDREVEVPTGATRNVPVALGAPACDGTPELAETPIVLTVVGGDGVGTPVEVALTAPDRLGQLAAWWEAACFAEAVAARAELAVRLVGEGATADTSGGTITLALEVTPRVGDVNGDAGDGSTQVDALRLTAIHGTILLGMLDDAGAPVAARLLDVALAPGDAAPLSLALTTVPARCDPHAIAEDKQGTLFRIEAALGDRAGTVRVAADPTTRAALYDAITRLCAETTARGANGP